MLKLSLFILVFTLPLIFDTSCNDAIALPKWTLILILVLTAVCTWVIKIVKQRKFTLFKSSLNLPILAFLLIALINTIYSVNSYLSFSGLYKFYFTGFISLLCYVLLYFLVVNNIDKKELELMITLILISSSIVALYGICQYWGWDFILWKHSSQRRVWSTLGNPNFLGAYLAMVIPLILSRLIQRLTPTPLQKAVRLSQINPRLNTLTFSRKQETNRTTPVKVWGFTKSFHLLPAIFYLMLFILNFFCLLFTYSRASWVAHLGSLIFFLLLMRKDIFLGNRKWWLFLGLFFVGFVLIFFSVKINQERTFPRIISRISSIVNFQEKDIASRISGWKTALGIIRKHPFLGTGLDTFSLNFRQYMASDYEDLSGKLTQPGYAHNEFLQIATTQGLIGIGIYLWLLITLFKKGIELLRVVSSNLQIPNSKLSHKAQTGNVSVFASLKEQRLLIGGLLTSCIAILIQNQFSFSILTTRLYFWLFIAFIVVMEKEIRGLKVVAFKGNKRQIWQLLRYIFFLLIGIVITFLMLFAIWRYQADKHFRKGIIFTENKFYDGAIVEYEKALKLNPRESLYLMNLGKGYYNKSFQLSTSKSKLLYLDKAINMFKKQISLYQRNALGHFGLGICFKEKAKLIDKDMFNKACKELRETIKYDPNFTDAYVHLGIIYEAMGEKEKAIDTYRGVLNINPNLALVHFNLGCIYANKKMYNKARMHWEKVLAIDPYYEKAERNLKIINSDGSERD